MQNLTYKQIKTDANGFTLDEKHHDFSEVDYILVVHAGQLIVQLLNTSTEGLFYIQPKDAPALAIAFMKWSKKHNKYTQNGKHKKP